MRHSAGRHAPAQEAIVAFRSRIVSWFEKNGRDYPWRRTKDPFRVLIAEIMLRRTKADQVERVYTDVFQAYPDVASFARADKAKLEGKLHSLGLAWRTPSFQEVARIIHEKYSGEVPANRRELIRLPGVGDYVAGAVLSIAYEKKEWIVDSNIVRVFRRYFGMETTVEGRRDRHVIATAQAYASCDDPRTANLAILDFASLVCKGKGTRHDECPVKETCRYIFESHQTRLREKHQEGGRAAKKLSHPR